MNTVYPLRHSKAFAEFKTVIGAGRHRHSVLNTAGTYDLICDEFSDHDRIVPVGRWILPLALLGLVVWIFIIGQFLSWFW